MSKILRAQILWFSACALLAEEARLSGPVPGYVFDSQTQAIRPMLGVAGSAYLGSPVATDSEVAAVAPDGAMALIGREGGLVLLRGLDTATPEALAIEGSLTGVSRLAWSDDGARAVAYSASVRQVQVLRDLAKSPVADAPADASGIEGAVSALAFDGSHVVVGAAGGVYLLGDGAPKLLAQAANPVDIEIFNNDLFVADRERQEIWEVRDFAQAATPMLFADERSGVSSPVGIEVLNGRLLVANAGNRTIDAFELANHTRLGHLDLDFTPSRLEALGRGPLALLNAPGGSEPLNVLDAGERFSVYFVPAGREQ